MTAKIFLVVLGVAAGCLALAERSAGDEGGRTLLPGKGRQTEAHWPLCEGCGGQDPVEEERGWSFAGALDVLKEGLRVKTPFVSVCARVPAIKEAIIQKIPKPCADITLQDLRSVTSLRITLQDLSRIRGRDLSGLENLKALYFDPPAQKEEKETPPASRLRTKSVTTPTSTTSRL